MAKKNKEFNIVICGVGGQGLITLLQVIAEAALAEGFEVKTSELHGLSQRGGSVETHIRFGPSSSLRTNKGVYSPLVPLGKADLILGLEISETLRRISFANQKTVFLVNQHYRPFPGSLSEKEIIKKLKTSIRNLYLISGSQICQKELGKEVVSGVYLLSFGSFKNLIPLKPNSIIMAIRKIIPKKYFGINKKAFELAKEICSKK